MYDPKELDAALELWLSHDLHLDPDRFKALIRSLPVLKKVGQDWHKKYSKIVLRAEAFREGHCGSLQHGRVYLPVRIRTVFRDPTNEVTRYYSAGWIRGFTPVHLPYKDPMGDRIKSCFTPPRGKRWYSTGWKHLDFWAVANLTRDPVFAEFAKAEDPFLWYAEKLGAASTLTPEYRKALKQHVYTAIYRRSTEAPGLFDGEYEFFEGIASPYAKDPFGKPFPERIKPSYAFSRILFEMAMAEAWRNEQTFECKLAFIYPDTLVWEVPEKLGEAFAAFASEAFNFEEVGRAMEWVVPAQAQVKEIRDFRDI